MGGNLSGVQAFRQILYTHHKETGDCDHNCFIHYDDNENDDVITFRAATTSCTRGRRRECLINLGSEAVLNIPLSKVATILKIVAALVKMVMDMVDAMARPC